MSRQCIGTELTPNTTVIPSSPRIAPVCNEDYLELTCMITGRVLEWHITVMTQTENITRSRLIDSSLQSPLSLSVNSVVITLSRTSSLSTPPVISRLVISQANTSINGSLITCTDRETRNSSSIEVKIIDRGNIRPFVQRRYKL